MMRASARDASADDSARDWVNDAVLHLEREAARSADTHLIQVEFRGFPGIRFYFKDEAAHPTGSLKHRLARSLFLYALCNGRLRRGQRVVDASSGSTAISEAWFARLLGVPFTAVVPACTAPGKLREIRELGGECDFVDASGTERAAMKRRNERGSIVSLLCDRGERYAETLFDPRWREARGLEIEPWLAALRHCTNFGEPAGKRTNRRPLATLDPVKG